MNTSNRRIKIFEKLLKDKKVEVNKLAKTFDVTTMTIRRDLALLEKQGIITCSYGGAFLNEGVSNEPSFELKNSQSLDSKISIGYCASKYVNDGETIYLDCGTTIYNMARYLTNKKITIITNSWPLIELFKDNNKIELILAPGKFNKTSNGAISNITINFLNNIHVDKAFIATHGFDINRGPCNPSEIDNGIKQTALKVSEVSYLLFDHSKLNNACTYYFEDKNLVKNIIIDENIEQKNLNNLKRKYKVIIAQSIKKNI